MGNTFNLTKKQSLWVGIVVLLICAIAFGVAFSAAPVVSASAEPEVPTPTGDVTDVIIEVTSDIAGDDAAYPYLLDIMDTRTITVKYYVDIPDGITDGDFSDMKFAPILTYPSGKVVRPDSIAVNPNFSSGDTVIALTSVNAYIDESLEEEERSASFNVSLNKGSISDLDGVDGNSTNEGKYLFSATYELTYNSERTTGVYGLTLNSYEEIYDEELDETYIEYYTEIGATDEDYLPAVTNPTFYVREAVAVPEYSDILDGDHSVVYNATEQTGIDFANGSLCTINGSMAATNAGDYPVTFKLDDTDAYVWDLGDGNYTTADQSYTWHITAKPVTLSFNDNGENYTVTYGADPATANPAAVSVSASGLEGNDSLGTLGYSIVKDAQEYNTLEGLSVGTYTLTTTYTANANYNVTTDTATYTVDPATVEVPATFSVEYDGESHGVATSALYDISSENGSTVSASTVGNYTSTLSLTDDVNYVWSVGGTADQTVTWSITAKAVVTPVIDTTSSAFTAQSGNGYVYDAQSHEIYWTSASTPDGALATYSGDKYATNVGNYTATWTLTDKTNYVWASTNDSEDIDYDWFIEKRVIEKPTIAVANYTYTGSAQTYADTTTWYSFTGSGTNVGYYPVTVSLVDTDNTKWNDNTIASYEAADKISIAKKAVTLTVAVTSNTQVYGQTPATVTVSASGLVNDGDLGTISYTAKIWGGSSYIYYTADQFEAGLDVGNYIIESSYTPNDNYVVDAQSSQPYEVTKASVTIPVADTSVEYEYDGTEQTFVFTTASTVDSALYNVANNKRTLAGEQTVTVTLINNNYQWADSTTAAKTYQFVIGKMQIDIPDEDETIFIYNGSAQTYTVAASSYYTVSGNVQTEIGEYTVTITLNDTANTEWEDGTIADLEYDFEILTPSITVSFTYSYAGTVTPIAENVEITNIYTATMRELPSFPYFKTAGWKVNGTGDVVTAYTLAMGGQTLNAEFTYNVGAGDADGDGVISTADVIMMRRWNVGLDRNLKVANAAAAWTTAHDIIAAEKAAEANNTVAEIPNYVLYSALDVNGDRAIRSSDIVAVRQALATGHAYKVIVENGITKVAKTNRVNVSNYADLIANIEIGNPVALTTNIEAANEIFNEDLDIPVDIYLGTNRLTVKGFTLNTNTAGATLKIWGDPDENEEGGIIYTVTGITITAPSGNVIVSKVNGYSYDGTVVNIAAYSQSLHIEDSVAFYIYKAQLPGTETDYDDVDHFLTEVYDNAETTSEIVTTLSTLATTRIGETEARMQDIKNIKADTEKNETEKAEAINALDVKKAIIEVPIDTHVVVEAGSTLDVDKLVVKPQANEAVTEEDVVTTFAIEVKNADAAVVTVDISEVKDDTGAEVVYVVDEVAVSGNVGKVDVVAGENTAAEVKKYVAQIGTTGYESLQDAITAAVNGDTIKLLASVADGTGLKTADDNAQHTKVGKTFTIDFAGFTYTVDGAGVGSTGTETQAMHWGEKDNITLKNGNFVISTKAATVANPANNKKVKMAMQNYADLTVKNMTMDFSNLVVQNYGTYTGKDAPYSGLEIPLFNLNAGSMLIENTTITMPNNSTKGALIEIPDAATIKNSTINGYVSLGQLDSNVTIIDSTVSGVVSYFAGYGVKHSGNVYRLGGVSVTNATELQAALDAGAIIIDIENDFNAPNPIAVSKSTIINGYDHTITSNGNRIMNVTEAGVVLTINDLTMTSATSERGLNIWNNATDTDITLNNVTIDAHLYGINYVNGADNETLTINNSSITAWGAINAHCNNSTFTVNDTTLYGINRNCDSQYAFSTVVIDGDSLHGAQEGDHGVDNTFVFNGCTIIAEVTLTHQYWISFQYAATGNVASVVVNNCQILDAPNGNDKSADMKIDGTNNAVVMALSAEQYAIVAAKHFNITDNGNGTYTIMPKTANISYFGTPYNFYDVFENGWLEDTEAFTLTDDVVLDTDVVFAESRDAAIAVSGGTFEMNLDGYTISGNGKILLPVGVKCVTDSTVSIASVFEAPEGEVVIESVDADGNYIYEVGVAYVKTKAEFTAAITAGAKKIVICADINLSMYTYNRNMDITIDLNGHTLTTTLTGITFSAARTLNILDSSANGTGAINSTGNYAINMGTASTAATTINIYGGTLTGKTSAAVKVNDGTLNVYGGTLTCPAADKYAVLNYQGYAGTVNIYDGTFTAAVAVANNGAGEVNIYGGTFSADPSDFVAPCYMAVEDEGTWTVVEAEITITTFAELKAAIADVNAGNIVYPTLIIANNIAFEEELTISKSVYIQGDGEVKFIGYDASTKYDEAFYINVADEDQEITIDGIVFDHFCYYSNVANKTKATASAVKNGVAYITYGGDCPASTTLYVTGCQFLGTARDMINASSTKGCKGFIVIEDCYFDATDRLSSTLNMLSFYGNEDAELYVMITGCTFKEASEQNATWATSAIASFGNADLTITSCEFIACQIGIAIDNTFDRLYSTSTYPVYYNTTVSYSDITYTNCYFGYFGEFFVEDVSEIPEEAELYTDEPFTYGDAEATQFHFAAEYDVYEAGEAGEAQHRIYLCYYVKAMIAVGGGEGAEGNPGLDD